MAVHNLNITSKNFLYFLYQCIQDYIKSRLEFIMKTLVSIKFKSLALIKLFNFMTFIYKMLFK